MKIGIIGYGELGQQLENFLIEIEPNIKIVSFDDSNSNFSLASYAKDINSYIWLIALGYKHLKLKLEIIDKINSQGGKFKSIIHESSYISKQANLHDGVICYPMCNIDKGVEIKNSTLLNNSVVVSHDVIIEEACYISPGVIISGNVYIKKGSFIGSGSVISNGITIGEFSKIGIGSVITKNVPDHSYVIGNPQKELSNPFILK